MQIHEITKGPQRTDEGLLDGIKSAVNSVKTGAANIQNKVQAWGDKAQEKQWNKQQDKINKKAQKAAGALARKGFNVDTTTPLAKAQTPGNIKAAQAQKIADLQKKFDDEFAISGGLPTVSGNKVTTSMNGGEYSKNNKQQWQNAQGTNVDKKSAAALNKQANTQYQTNPDAAKLAAQQKAAGYNPRARKKQDIQPIKPAAKKAAMPAQTAQPAVTRQNPARVNAQAQAQAQQARKKNPARSLKEEWELFKEALNPQQIKAQRAARAMPKAQPAQQTNTGVAPVQPTAPATPPAKGHTGGKVPGQLSQSPNAVRQRAARAAKNGGGNAIKSKFLPWIKSQIPGLDAAYQDPATKKQLDQAFTALTTAQGKEAIDAAFNQYASIAINAASKAGGQQGDQQSGQPGGRFNASLYASGIDPAMVTKLKSLLQQNHEKPPAPNTSSDTVNKLIKAVGGGQ